MNRLRKLAPLLIACGLLAAVAWVAVHTVFWFWARLRVVEPALSVGILTAVTTVFVATVTVVLGRYYERKKDIEAAYRQKKTEIYDEFLREFFRIFYNPEGAQQAGDDRVVQFFREWQRKIILWGGQDVLKGYVEWMRKLKAGQADADSMFKMEDFLRTIRADLGQTNWKLPKGTFIHFILRDADLFLAAAKKNPRVTLAELATLEAEIAKAAGQTNVVSYKGGSGS